MWGDKNKIVDTHFDKIKKIKILPRTKAKPSKRSLL